jgi:hypothetical protein
MKIIAVAHTVHVGKMPQNRLRIPGPEHDNVYFAGLEVDPVKAGLIERVLYYAKFLPQSVH